ncbi:dihydropteroate synthase [Afifella sp. JA880]|uniref:dihydropteroate synthase n=1 Tax=Afifella sp. JA880 TaxID=2975280 RepID=UPI0021BA8D8F|nr:dihydropteroate synthase [Afifella sp. JA880]MCT8266528.1 dihydropteroate synthase [Afifella sp. JA880]
MTHSASSARAQPFTDGVGDGFASLLRSWREAGDARVPIVMGIVNVTPDSFSDGGQFFRTEAAIEHGLRLHDQGAAILDVGGESTRANAEPVAADEEIRRILPVIEALTANGILVSVDTMKAEVAKAAVSAGAQILNDVRGLLGDPEMAEVAARTGAGVIAMHNQGVFGSAKPMEIDPVAGCIAFFRRALDVAHEAGVAEDRLVLDPGFGFGKSPEQNLQLLARFGELETLGLPLLAGTSRKSFIAKIAGADGTDRLAGTLATNVVAALAGAAIVRVHDVAEHVAAMRIAAAIRGANTNS